MRTVDPKAWPKRAQIRRLENSGSRLEAALRAGLCDAARDYRRHCSLPGLARRAGSPLPAPDRCQRCVVWLALVCCAMWAAAAGGAALHGAPPQHVVSFPAARPVRTVPFPAVALY